MTGRVIDVKWFLVGLLLLPPPAPNKSGQTSNSRISFALLATIRPRRIKLGHIWFFARLVVAPSDLTRTDHDRAAMPGLVLRWWPPPGQWVSEQCIGWWYRARHGLQSATQGLDLSPRTQKNIVNTVRVQFTSGQLTIYSWQWSTYNRSFHFSLKTYSRTRPSGTESPRVIARTDGW